MPHRFYAACASLLLVVGCGDDPPEVIPTKQVSGTFVLTSQFAFNGRSPGLPATIDGQVMMDVDAEGAVTGVLALYHGGPVSTTAVSGHLVGRTVTLGPLSVFWGGDISVVLLLEHLQLAVNESGLIDGSPDPIAGDCRTGGDVSTPCTFTATIAAGEPDTRGGQANLWSQTAERGLILPTATVCELSLGDLVDVAQLGRIRVLANGQPVPATVYPSLHERSKWIGSAAVTAIGPWPLGATISVDLDGLTDPHGNLLQAGDVLHVVPDPGPITANLGFEQGAKGWIGPPDVFQFSELYDILRAVEGSTQAVLAQSQIMGYFDVAQDASTLSFSAAVVAATNKLDRWIYDAGYVTIELVRSDGGRIELFDPDDERAAVQPCDCGSSPRRIQIGPLTKAFDLRPYRGERLLLVAAIVQPQEGLALFLDDLRIE